MYIFWRDTASDLWTPVLFSYIVSTVLIDFHHHLLVGLISLSSYFTFTHLILCVQQAGEIDNLSVSLVKILDCDCVQVRVNL